MSKELVDKEHSLQALQEMIQERNADKPVEEVLATFCQRYSLSIDSCRALYEELVEKGKIKEK